MGRSGSLKPASGFVITRLINSTYYSIRTCFILKTINTAEFYRLLVIHDNVLADRNYPTLRGAKIAFKNQFKKFAWREDIAAEWSHFYPPDRDWLDKMLSKV